MLSPIEQFRISTIGKEINLAGLNISFSNSALFMVITVVLIFLFFYISLKRTYIIPNKMQMLAELSYNFVAGLSKENIGEKANIFFPLVYTIFLFILFGNLLGILPYSFAFTSQVAITFSLAGLVFVIATLYGIFKHGFKFLKIFIPPDIPFILIPLMFIIEVLSYVAKALSMGIRLFANIMAGHIILEIFASFVISLGIFGFIPFSITILIFGFEIAMACLQAYVFTILTCLFLQQVTEFH